MRKLGLIGGMSWVSTVTYYQQINRLVNKAAGGMTSAPLLIESLDFSTLCASTSAEQWDHAAQELTASALRLQDAGAQGLVIGANSMHKVYDQVAGAIDIPVLHIADCVGAQMKADNCHVASLIGTRNVMTESFYRQRLVAHGVDLLPPDMSVVEEVNRIIYEELMVGKITRDAQREMRTIITNKEKEGARGIVLACTELELVVDVDVNLLPIFDSTRAHCQAAANFILGKDQGLVP
ncbi:MAG: aspartate/glutamate racemase family protein [Sphingomonadaceae bacterium]